MFLLCSAAEVYQDSKDNVVSNNEENNIAIPEDENNIVSVVNQAPDNNMQILLNSEEITSHQIQGINLYIDINKIILDNKDNLTNNKHFYISFKISNLLHINYQNSILYYNINQDYKTVLKMDLSINNNIYIIPISVMIKKNNANNTEYLFICDFDASKQLEIKPCLNKNNIIKVDIMGYICDLCVSTQSMIYQDSFIINTLNAYLSQLVAIKVKHSDNSKPVIEFIFLSNYKTLNKLKSTKAKPVYDVKIGYITVSMAELFNIPGMIDIKNKYNTTLNISENISIDLINKILEYKNSDNNTMSLKEYFQKHLN